MRYTVLLLTAAIVAAAAFAAVDLVRGDEARAEPVCGAQAFPWGGECWRPDEGAEFVAWLNRHGTTAVRFKANYPQLAAKFDRPWPPSAYWKTCVTGAACVAAVLPHYFEDWRYAYSIVRCETGGTFYNRTVGDAGERGIFQIHPVHFGWADPSRLFDVRYNAQVAFRLSEHGRDWSPWTCA